MKKEYESDWGYNKLVNKRTKIINKHAYIIYHISLNILKLYLKNS